MRSSARLQRVHALLDEQIDDDGLHRTRSAKVQVLVMEELMTIRQALRRSYEQLRRRVRHTAREHAPGAGRDLARHRAKPAYFNGTGQMPHDLMVAVQAQSPARARATGVAGGYGRLIAGRAIVVADSGLVPEPANTDAHACQRAGVRVQPWARPVVCNCGPSPAGDRRASAAVPAGDRPFGPDDQRGVGGGDLRSAGRWRGGVVQMGAWRRDHGRRSRPVVVMRCHGYEDRFGVALERRLTLLAEGKSLVGQDRLLKARSRAIGRVRDPLPPWATRPR